MRIAFAGFICALALSGSCTPDPISSIMGPLLLATSPLHFGDSPIHIRTRGRLVITNGGDSPLEINDFKVEPDDGTFQIGMESLPLQIAGRRSKEITIQFWPRVIDSYRAELSFKSNHAGDALTPITLLGNGISNEVCLPCTPPPEPECHLDRESSLYYLPNTSTDCESESGECSYRIVEIPCEDELCDLETGLCPNGTIPTFDAGPAEEPTPDAGNTDLPECGNDMIEEGEECDDGNITPNDGCSATCTSEGGWDCALDPCVEICGDEQIVGDEECDDGNTTPGDGCSATCTIESGWICDVTPCVAICGDGILIEGIEECDDNNTIIDNCNYGEANCVVCGDSCTFVPGITQTCGDDVLQAAEEECDDGTENSDTTPNTCRTNCLKPFCSDGVTDDGETCDDGNNVIEYCDYGVSSCTVCGISCSWVAGITENCGDGTIQTDELEECDDGISLDGGIGNSNTEPDACRENCKNPFCGDDVQDSDEACDPGPTPQTLCPYAVVESSCDVCSADCDYVPGTTQYCGDGVEQTEEECDVGTDPTTGNSNERADACRENCVDYRCGDGWTDNNEECDDGNDDNLIDGCQNCTISSGWECTGPPTVCTPVTGGPGETCEIAISLTGEGGDITGYFGNDDDLRAGSYNNASNNSLSCPHNDNDFGGSDGPETVYKITLSPGETLIVENALPTSASFDISIYILDDCDTNSGSCVEGADVGFEGNPESLSYLASGTGAHEFFLVIDAWCYGDPCPTSSDTFTFTWSVIPPM